MAREAQETWREEIGRHLTVPIMLVIYGLMTLAGSAIVAGAIIPTALAQGHALDAKRFCADGWPEPCLDVVPCYLHGPYEQRRDVNDFVTVFARDGGRRLGSMDIDGGYSEALEAHRDDAEAWMLDDRIVAIDTPEGYVPSAEIGRDAGIQLALISTAGVGFGVALVAIAVFKRRLLAGWTDATRVRVALPPRLSAVVLAVIMLPGSGFIGTLLLGLTWWIGLLAGVMFWLYVVVAMRMAGKKSASDDSAS